MVDPNSYTKPRVSETNTYELDETTEIGEDFCIPLKRKLTRN